MRVYLAGKMGGRDGHDVLHERTRAAQACAEAGLEYIDPARGENIQPGKAVDLRMDYLTMKAYVTKDEEAIRHCDALLVLTGDTPSEGTGWEMGLAHFSLHMPIVMVSPLRVKGELMGFSTIKVDAIFETVEEATEFIAANYFPREGTDAIY
jgi:nucleoside 2-deoxyribosyltransferase